jgi:tetratricopeptide (TPR) repeat protein
MLDMLSSALRLDPQNTPALMMLIQLSDDASKNGEEARRMLKERLAAGEAPWVIHLVLGTSSIGDAGIEEAEKHLEQALAQNARVPATLNNLAWLLASKKDPDLDRAFRLSDQAVKLAPGTPEVMETRGQILLKLGKWQEALADLERVLPYYTQVPRLEPNRPMLHAAISLAYEKLGNAEMAALHREKAGNAALPGTPTPGTEPSATDAIPGAETVVPPAAGSVPIEPSASPPPAAEPSPDESPAGDEKPAAP